ncbi:hypothetical protein BH11PSE3_BH11PSE3_29980 [soil metagenome]
MHDRAFALLRTLMQEGRRFGGIVPGLVIEPSELGLAILLPTARIGLPDPAGLAIRPAMHGRRPRFGRLAPDPALLIGRS